MLSDREKRRFVEDGYLVKRISLSDETVAKAIDLAWNHIEPHFVRDDPDTWQGDITDSCRTAGIAKRRGRVKLRECVRNEPWLVDVIYGNPEITAMIQSLLGPNGGPRRSIRGLYPIFRSPTSSSRLAGGMDAHAFQVCCILYLTHVDPDGGEFNLWKGSHRIMQHAFPGKASWTMLDNVDELRSKAEAECKRVALPGPVGTVILWHHRLLHTPGTNRSRKVRHALIADFIQHDWESKAEQPHDSDMWADWAVSEAGPNWGDRIRRGLGLARGVLPCLRP